MQDKKLNSNEFILLAIPTEILEEAGVSQAGILYISARKGTIVIKAAENEDDYICDGNCEECEFFNMDCDEDCANCPCFDFCEECVKDVM